MAAASAGGQAAASMRAASPPASDGDGPDTPRGGETIYLARGGETIYLRHFSLAVETVMRERAELCELFSTEERAIAAPFLPAGREREKENTSRASLSKPLPNHF